MSFGQFQNETYFLGLGGTRPALPVTAAGLEELARETLPPEAFAYIAGGASTERTMANNIAAFDEHWLVPRMWTGASAPDGRDLSVTVLGTHLLAPVLTAPIGVLELVHPDAEKAVARAVAPLGVGSVLSTASSTTIEDYAATLAEAGGAPWWYQLYWPGDDEVAQSLVERAEKAGASAIIVTADTQGMGWRPRDLELAHLPFLQGKGVANYFSDPVFRSRLQAPPEESEQARQMAVLTWVGMFGNHALRPESLGKLREWTSLPIAVKGILHPDDARAVVDAGANGVVVSNHGGRQVDGSIASLQALGGVVSVIDGQADVLLDSGIRCGSDVLATRELGATAVLYGRPWVYGLGLAGAEGVTHALRALLADLDITAGMAGVTRFATD